MTDNDCLSSRRVCCWSILSIRTTTHPSLLSSRLRLSKFKTGVLLERFMYANHHTTTPYRQPLTAEQTQREGVVDTNYIQEVTPKVVANAVRIVIRICKIFFQTGLFIIVNNGFEQFLHACRCSSRHMKRSNSSRKTVHHDSQNILTCLIKRSITIHKTF